MITSLEMAHIFQIPPEYLNDSPNTAYQTAVKQRETFLETKIKPLVARLEIDMWYNVTIPLLLADAMRDKPNIIVCETCTQFRILPKSGKRWANSLRKNGWGRCGKNWYCPKCVSRNLPE